MRKFHDWSRKRHWGIWPIWAFCLICLLFFFFLTIKKNHISCNNSKETTKNDEINLFEKFLQIYVKSHSCGILRHVTLWHMRGTICCLLKIEIQSRLPKMKLDAGRLQWFMDINATSSGENIIHMAAVPFCERSDVLRVVSTNEVRPSVLPHFAFNATSPVTVMWDVQTKTNAIHMQTNVIHTVCIRREEIILVKGEEGLFEVLLSTCRLDSLCGGWFHHHQEILIKTFWGKKNCLANCQRKHFCTG